MLELLTALSFIGFLGYLVFYDTQRADSLAQPAAAPPFFDRKFFLHAVLAGLGGVLVLLVARQGYGIHVPYLAAVLSGVSLGWLQPRKGWLLAIFQVVVLLAGYYFLTDQFVRKDLAAFSVFGSVGLILVGGLLGGVLKRNL